MSVPVESCPLLGEGLQPPLSAIGIVKLLHQWFEPWKRLVAVLADAINLNVGSKKVDPHAAKCRFQLQSHQRECRALHSRTNKRRNSFVMFQSDCNVGKHQCASWIRGKVCSRYLIPNGLTGAVVVLKRLFNCSLHDT